jgi:N-formylglutamate deformylase
METHRVMDPEHNAPIAIGDELLAAYRATLYDVETAAGWMTLRVGQVPPKAFWAAVAPHRRVAVVSACNPFSVATPAPENERQQARLVAVLEESGRSWCPALGRDPSGVWQAEQSVAVFDASDVQLDAWMLAFGQNAVVVANAAGPLELRLHPDAALPDWVVLHVPHDSTLIPPWVRDQFLLDDEALGTELARMTDHHTARLFGGALVTTAQRVRAEVSRLVVDVERFEDDERESMASRGMGAVYSVASGLEPLRRALTPAERQSLIERFYLPHHAALTMAVDRALARHGRCLVIDCHSFPSVALPYELLGGAGGAAPQPGADEHRTRRQAADHPSQGRPDICIGTDRFHTPEALRDAFVASFACFGWTVRVDSPFAGALVPAAMVEVNRALYMDESTSAPLPNFAEIAGRIRRCCVQAVVEFGARCAQHLPPRATPVDPTARAVALRPGCGGSWLCSKHSSRSD